MGMYLKVCKNASGKKSYKKELQRDPRMDYGEEIRNWEANKQKGLSVWCGIWNRY